MRILTSIAWRADCCTSEEYGVAGRRRRISKFRSAGALMRDWGNAGSKSLLATGVYLPNSSSPSLPISDLKALFGLQNV